MSAIFAPPEDRDLAVLLERLLGCSGKERLGAALQLRWSVSFHRRGLRERYVTRERPASPFAMPFLGGGPFTGNGEVRRYRVDAATWWIDYDRDRLAAEGNVVPPLETFRGPKVAICQHARTIRAAVDVTDQVLKDTFLCGVPVRGGHVLGGYPEALVGVLCSRAAHWFYSHVFEGGHVANGYLHYLQSFLADLPLGRWDEAAAEVVSELVRKRAALEPGEEAEQIEEEIETWVSRALGLRTYEAELIREWAAEDENWRRRERVRPAGHGAASCSKR